MEHVYLGYKNFLYKKTVFVFVIRSFIVVNTMKNDINYLQRI